MWLISYRRQAIYKTANGLSRNEPVDAFALTKLNPANFLARAQARLIELEEAPFDPARGPQSAAEVLRIYSATPFYPNETPVGLDVYGDDA